VLWDRQTESWWQQAGGNGLVGAMADRRLAGLPVATVSFAELQQAYPDAMVLSRETGWRRDYGRNPYVGYDDPKSLPFAYKGPFDARVGAMERVAGVSLGGEAAAYPLSSLAQAGVVNDTLGGERIVVLYATGTASALDRNDISDGRDVGSAAVYRSVVDGRALTFESRGGALIDAQTGSAWSVLGRARTGPLAGRELEPAIHATPFWFAWYAFEPGTRVWGQ
jgi:hypothetical protein